MQDDGMWQRLIGDSDVALNHMSNLDKAVSQGSFLGRFIQMMGSATGDPNVRRAMGQLGSGLSQKGSFGQVVGDASDQLNRNQAMQEAGGQVGEQQGNNITQLLKAILEGSSGGLVGDRNDPNTANSYTVSDKGIRLDLPNPSALKKLQNQYSPQRQLEGESGSNDRALMGIEDMGF